MQFNVKQAKRELIWSKIAILGPSGSGKTYSALRMATGMISRMKEKGVPVGNGKILVINTEGSRGLYYANEFKYDIINTDETFPNGNHSPENYIEALAFATKEQYPVCIVDSSSAEWEGKGGCLELHQLAGGNFQSWAKVTPRHDRFIQALANSPMHIIATMRGKDQYEIEKGDKLNVKKLGVGARQREGFEYEFTSTFSLDGNFATSQKDNTHLFEVKGRFKISEKDGEDIIDWANSGEGYTPKPVPAVVSTDTVVISDEVAEMKKENFVLCTKLKNTEQKDSMLLLLDKYVPDKKRNPNLMTNEAEIKALFGELSELMEVVEN